MPGNVWFLCFIFQKPILNVEDPGAETDNTGFVFEESPPADTCL